MGDDKLRAAFDQLPHPAQQVHLPRGRQRRFGLVENVKSVAEKAVFEQREETLAVRLLVERAVAVVAEHPVGDLLQFRRHIVETLGAQEIAVARGEAASQYD